MELSDSCDGGQYGPSRCSLSCGQCEDGQQCHPVTGHCPRCHPGFYPPLCVEACENKTYGQNCNESCGQCKGGQPCNTATGSCTTGCEPGYIGELCNDTCDEGLYGAECNQTCGHCQVNTTCHHQHGQCLVGCAPGFTGNLCEDVKKQENNYDSPHPNSKTDPDREVYMELALFPSEVTTSSNKAD
ncbi:scavenger receptor class F member 1-like [Littorina saxatilis]|uniref:scavenger receptor class F member 1-like n=1 Tax=Littorina saxatilis TaxID=31220 RepID=UPI0038B5F94E